MPNYKLAKQWIDNDISIFNESAIPSTIYVWTGYERLNETDFISADDNILNGNSSSLAYKGKDDTLLIK